MGKAFINIFAGGGDSWSEKVIKSDKTKKKKKKKPEQISHLKHYITYDIMK